MFQTATATTGPTQLSWPSDLCPLSGTTTALQVQLWWGVGGLMVGCFTNGNLKWGLVSLLLEAELTAVDTGLMETVGREPLLPLTLTELQWVLSPSSPFGK